MKNEIEWKSAGINGYMVGSNGKVRDHDGKEVKQSEYGGHKVVKLKNINGFSKYFKVHRLVAKAFIENPNNYPDVVFKRGNSPAVSNLRWCSRAESVKIGMKGKIPKGKKHWNYGKKKSASTKKLMAAAKMGENHPAFKGYYVCGENKFTTLGEAATAMGVNATTVLRRVNADPKMKGFENWTFQPK
jgi:hypothetical protein